PRVENDQVIGAAYFQRSVRADLYTILAQWPDSTLAGEIFLAERSNSGIKFLSPLLFSPQIPALSLVVPGGDNKTLAEQGLNSQTGLVQGLDYAGNQVLGATYLVPGTPWVLVAKVLRADGMRIANMVSLISALAAIVLLIIFSLALWAILRTRHQRHVVQQHAAMKAILDNLPQGVVLLDQDMRVRAFNRGAYEVFGMPSSSYALGKPFSQILQQWADHCGYGPDMLKRAVKEIDSPLAFNFEMPIHANGGKGWCSLTHTPLADGGYVRTFTDITALKQAESRVKTLNSNFLTMLDNARDFIYFKDMDSRIVFCSQAMADITDHVNWRDMVGKHDFEIFPPDTAKVYNDEEKAIYERGESVVNKVNPYYDENGKTGWVETNKWPIFDDGGTQVIGLFGISRDVTERINLETALERSNTELEQFAYVVSHDLRQPLRMISSYTTLLTRQLGDTLDGQAREFLGYILDGSKRMNDMMASLLEYSRVGRKGEPMEMVQTRKLAEEAVHFLHPIISETNAQISFEGEWPQIFASPNETTRLFQNLVGNGLKYQKPGNQPQIILKAWSKGKQSLFSVSDNGIGIAADQADRLFKVFQRLHSATDYEGSGIGLAVCRKIVERHGGAIWLDSEFSGPGARFVLSLPQDGAANRAALSLD
ncbi:MAG: PAS domain-containing protein, partial [Magnetospirillum sp.]